MTKFEFQAIGTSWQIDIYKELSSEEEALLLSQIKNRIDVFDKDYSRFRQDSLVTKISKEKGGYVMPEDFKVMFELYKKAYNITDCLVTPLIGSVLVEAGYDANYSLKKGELKKPKKLEDVLEWRKPTLIIKEPVLLDFGACGKGYLVDIVSEIIEKNNIHSYCVDAGGDMRHRKEDEGKLRVGLEHPDDKESVIGVIELGNRCLCGSAGNRRKWADMHHIINPNTLTSPKEISAIWAIADTTIIADILTTCLFFINPEKLKNYFNFEYLILNSDYSVNRSDKFNAELYFN